MTYCEKCQRDKTDYCYRCKHGYYGSKDEEQNRRYDLSEYYKPIENEQNTEYVRKEKTMSITRTQIMNCLSSYIENRIKDAQWHIALVTDFMFLLDGDNFNSDDLTNKNYIKSVIHDNKDDKYAKKVLMRDTPETYISALFQVVIDYVNNDLSE